MPGKQIENDVNGTNGTKDPRLFASSKSLYQGAKDSNKKWTWVEQDPEDVDDAAENEETALITRLQKANDSRKVLNPLNHHSATIDEGCPRRDPTGIHCGLKRLEAPYSSFVHCWPQLLDYRGRMDLDSTIAEHIQLLYDVLEPSSKTLEDYVDYGMVTFDHIWIWHGDLF
jgi:hypothetical protein